MSDQREGPTGTEQGRSTETASEPIAELPRYRLLTGRDDAAFCRRVSEALDDGYELYGSPSVAFADDHVVVAQAVQRVGEGLRHD